MPSSVLIILVAVVVLIAVVVFGGIRYLRSDEEEDFDAVATERAPSRRSPAAQDRPRRAHDDYESPRDLPRPAARSGRDAAARRDGDARREPRPERHGYYDDDRTELVPVGGRASHQGRNGAGSVPASGRPRPAARESGREARDLDRDSAAGRKDGRATRTAPAVREVAVANLDALERRSAARNAGRPDSHGGGRGGRSQQEAELPQVKPRPGKGKGKSKGDSDGDWPSNEWDELSDVDYWTELAADKPFAGDAPSTGPGRVSTGRSDRTEQLRQEPRRSEPARAELHRSEPARSLPARSLPARPEPIRPEPIRPEPARAEPARFEPARAERLRQAGSSRRAHSRDDDPLTSPSFPRVEANDSRSYRRSRSGTHERPATDYAAAPAGYDQPAAIGRAADDGYRNTPASNSVPESYQVPAVGYGYNGSVPASYQMPAASSGAYPATGGYEWAQPGQPTAPASGYGYGSDSVGYSGYDGQAAANGYPGYGTDGIGSGSHYQQEAGYLPGTQAAYPYQPGVPESYQAPAAATAPYQYQQPSGQPRHTGELGGYAGADPYAVDPYGYSGYGNGSY